jgi:hypothetical protein
MTVNDHMKGSIDISVKLHIWFLVQRGAVKLTKSHIMYLFLVFLLTLTNILEVDGNNPIPISSPPLLGEGSRPA